jgi:mono/diheme cytochrome c family protein
MNRTSWAGLVATGLLSLTVLAGCSDDPPPGPNLNPAGGTGGTGNTPSAATMLSPPLSYTILSGPNAVAATTPAPAAYTGVNACNSCHGVNAEGIDNTAPDIRHVPPVYGAWIIRNGGARGMGFSTMSPFAVTALSDADMQAILTWVDSMPKPTTPEGLYKDFCGNCHGPSNPTGGAVAVNIKGIKKGLVTAYVRSGNGMDPMQRGEYMPAFDTTLLTDPELDQIQTYIGSIP